MADGQAAWAVAGGRDRGGQGRVGEGGPGRGSRSPLEWLVSCRVKVLGPSAQLPFLQGLSAHRWVGSLEPGEEVTYLGKVWSLAGMHLGWDLRPKLGSKATMGIRFTESALDTAALTRSGFLQGSGTEAG